MALSVGVQPAIDHLVLPGNRARFTWEIIREAIADLYSIRRSMSCWAGHNRLPFWTVKNFFFDFPVPYRDIVVPLRPVGGQIPFRGMSGVVGVSQEIVQHHSGKNYLVHLRHKMIILIVFFYSMS